LKTLTSQILVISTWIPRPPGGHPEANDPDDLEVFLLIFGTSVAVLASLA
jgi:hypothetical protein